MIMKKYKFRQCKVKRKVPNGIVQMVSFLPENFAVIGKVLKLKDENTGKWTDGWVVEFVGDLEDKPLDYRKAIRKHRNNTGDSTPKKPPESN